MSMDWVMWAIPDDAYARRYGPTSKDGIPDVRAVERMSGNIDAWEVELDAELLPPEAGMTSRSVANILEAARGVLPMPLLSRFDKEIPDDRLCRHFSAAETKALLAELEEFARLLPNSEPMQPDACFQGDYLDRVRAAVTTDRGLWAIFG